MKFDTARNINVPMKYSSLRYKPNSLKDNFIYLNYL